MQKAEYSKSKIIEKLALYLEEWFSLTNDEFTNIVFNLFINEDNDAIEELFEPNHISSIRKLILPYKNALLNNKVKKKVNNSTENSLNIRMENNLNAEANIKENKNLNKKANKNLNENTSIEDSYKSNHKVVKAIKATSCSEEENSSFNFDSLPETLIHEFHEEPEIACLKSFIYKIENNQTDDKEETVEDKIGEIREALRNDPVVLVQGNTGCGKTTKIPRMLMDEYASIVCTQPRRLAAINVARKVSSDLKCKLGQLVGYNIRFDDKTSKETRLRFVTDGILLKEISSSRTLGKYNNTNISDNNRNYIKYDLIIIDEAHERTINIDFLLGYLKTLPNTKLLVMSATLDSERLIDYFNCPFIEIKHKMHKIDHFYLKAPEINYLSKTIECVHRIIEEYSTGDVLVFLTGQEEIDQVATTLLKYIGDKVSCMDILKLYSTMPAEEQDLIFKKGKRKIILSTNIAETSITIENIKFVVDCGKVKQKRRSSDSSIDFLEIITISKAQAKQRAGRAGRTSPGSVFRIYTHDEYIKMADNSVPEILRSNLSNVILSLKSLGIKDVVNFNYLDKPPKEHIKNGLRFLYYLKAIDGTGNITELGRRISDIPLDPEMAMALYHANVLGCLDEVSTIAAFLNCQPFFNENYFDLKKLKKIKESFVHKNGDFYTFLEIYSAWKSKKFSFDFLKNNCLKIKTMQQISKIKSQLMNYFLRSRGKTSNSNQIQKPVIYENKQNLLPSKDSRIEESFCAGYFMNIAKKSERGYATIFGGTECLIHPKDGLFKEHPKYVLFFEIVCIRKEFMRNCLEINTKHLSKSCNRVFEK